MPFLLPAAQVQAQGAPGEPEGILLRADPEIIRADGQSTSTIIAEVRDREGRFVPDGTEVRFSTSLGRVDPVLSTRGGVVRATLQSAATEGVADVTATSGVRGFKRVQVTFSSESVPGQQMKPFLRIEGQSLNYVPEKALIDAAGQVRVTYRGCVLTANLLQLDVNSLRVKAWNSVRLRAGNREITADRMALDMQTLTGSLVAIEANGTLRRQTFTGHRLAAVEMQGPQVPGLFDFEDIENAKAVMGARKITLFPNDKMQFSRFRVSVAGAKVISLPFYVLSLNPYSESADQYLSYDSVGGVSVNLPFYYSVTDNTNGSVRLQRQSRTGYGGYSLKPGWQLALDQRYSLGTGTTGLVELNQITGKDWGLRWRHEQQFGTGTHSYLSLDSPAHRDLYLRGDFHHTTGLGDLSLSSYGSFVPDTSPSMQSRLYFRFKPGIIKGPDIRYYWTANMGWNKWGQQSFLEEGLDLQVHPPDVRLNKSLRLSFYGGGGYAASPSGTGPTAQASAGLHQRLGTLGSASLRYSYYFSGRVSDYYGPTTSQSITGQMLLGGRGRWSTSLTATLSPDSGDISAYGRLMWSPLPHWRLDMGPTYSRFGRNYWSGSTPSPLNLDVYLVREIGGRDVALRWSTLDKRIRLELATTALRF